MNVVMKHVAVIGAGAAGLAALRSLSKQKDLVTFKAFEQSDGVGGTWIHNDPYKPTSMYDNLRTNLPKEVMAFPELPFSSDIYDSYVTHQQVLEYLDQYARHFDLLKYISFRHSVLEVDPVASPPDASGDKSEVWKVVIRDNVSGHVATEQFDAVMVCNGHYTTPLIPEVDGLDSFKGEMVHSHYYRKPEVYTGKVVFVLGAGPSGLDIALDIAPFAKQVYMGHNKARLTTKLPDNVVETVGIQRVSGRDLELLNGDKLQPDVLMLATGYIYEFPFLTKKCHPVIRNQHVCNIYRMLVDIEHPRLFYVGLNKSIVPFPQFYCQTEFAVAMIVGRVATLSKEDMMKEHDELYKSLVLDCNKREKDFHFIKDYQWMYNSELVALAGNEALNQAVEDLYKRTNEQRRHNLCAYKTAVYRFDEHGKFTIVSEPPTGSD